MSKMPGHRIQIEIDMKKPEKVITLVVGLICLSILVLSYFRIF